jgi:hypothetical protein
MAMKLLPFHKQSTSDFSTYDEHDNLVFLHIIQGTQVSCTQFELGEGIGAQPFDSFRRCGRLVLKAGQYGRFQDPLVTSCQRLDLPVSILGDGNLERHATAPRKTDLSPPSWR